MLKTLRQAILLTGRGSQVKLPINSFSYMPFILTHFNEEIYQYY